MDYAPHKYKLSEDLSKLLDIKLDTKPNVIMALWQYIKVIYYYFFFYLYFYKIIKLIFLKINNLIFIKIINIKMFL